MDAAANRTIAHLQSEAARVTVRTWRFATVGWRPVLPSRTSAATSCRPPIRPGGSWLHVTVRDRNGNAVFESGALNPTGAIQGNDNDEDGSRVRAALHRDHTLGPGADLRDDHGGRRTGPSRPGC